ncbi:hypothetical protein EGW08_002807 [Elysia chlorotica]|uniref:Uncharacterized protein n=1 Tax=Elysia chlorotica TaxID=188477 RepID=A0A433U6M3_ELYCH|nr:hypothetical protein EGW08_002807 [Elysia chlorotica]
MTTEETKEPTPSENDYVNCDSSTYKSSPQSTKSSKSNNNGTGTINEAYYRSDPDVIVRQPITAQPSLTSLYSTGCEAWAYAPSGISPIQRSDLGSLTNVAGTTTTTYDTKSRSSISTIPKDSVSVTGGSSGGAASGSRDWAKDLFEPLMDVRKSSNKRSTLAKLLCQCVRVPCMTCDVARSLGDPAWLPYVPCTGAALRFKVRILGGIQGTIADDCIVTSFCCPCAVCQMSTEIDDIGLGRS